MNIDQNKLIKNAIKHLSERNATLDKLRQFATKHDVALQEKGEVGFGRPCVGFLRNGNYIDYNPRTHPEYELAFPADGYYLPPNEVEAYHKYDCLAVMVHDGNYDEALRQLAVWVDDMEAKGVYLVEYETSATGLQALISGVFGYAFRFSKQLAAEQLSKENETR